MGCDCENNKKPLERRNFLTKIIVGIGTIIGGILSIPLVTSMLDPVMRDKKKVWRQVGDITDFKEGETRLVTFESASPYHWGEGISRSAAYVRREKNNSFTAFSVNCAHLGCPVRWVQDAELFLCPCHGGVYYKDGSRAAGPPPRGLFTYPIRVANQKVEIETEAVPLTNIG